MCRAEILKNIQPFTEVGFNRCLDNLTARLSHQSTHTGKLLNLVNAASRTRITHNPYRIQIWNSVSGVILHRVHHRVCNFNTGMCPNIYDLIISFTIGQNTVVIILHDIIDFLLSLIDNKLLFRRYPQINKSETQTRKSRLLKADLLDIIKKIYRHCTAGYLKAIMDHIAKLLLIKKYVVKRHLAVKNIIEQTSAGRSLYNRANFLVFAVKYHFVFRKANLDPGMYINLTHLTGRDCFKGIPEYHSLTLLTITHTGNIIITKHHILRWAKHRGAVLW